MRLAASGSFRDRTQPPASSMPGWDDAPVSGTHAPPTSAPETAAPRYNDSSLGEIPGGQLDWDPDRSGRHSAQPNGGQIQSAGGPLPVRQPGQTIRQPMSPSGSLWERAVEPAAEPPGGQDTGSRPTYAWQPDSADESTDERPQDGAPWRPDWRVPEWTDGNGSGS